MNTSEALLPDREKLEAYAQEFSGEYYLLPNDPDQQKMFVERAVYWLLSGRYPETPIKNDNKEDADELRMLLDDVNKEAKKQAVESQKLDKGKKWSTQYDYWHSPSGFIRYIKGFVSVTPSKDLSENYLRVSSPVNENTFVAEGLVGLSEKAFHSIFSTNWEKNISKYQDEEKIVEEKKNAYDEFTMTLEKLGLDFEDVSKKLRSNALYEYYIKTVDRRINTILKSLNNGDGDFEVLFQKMPELIDKVFAKLTPEGKEKAVNMKVNTSPRTQIKIISNVSGVEINKEIYLYIGRLPCRLDSTGNFSVDFDKAWSYSIGTGSEAKIDANVTPMMLAGAKIQLEKDFNNSLK